jgi:hypothetical protein
MRFSQACITVALMTATPSTVVWARRSFDDGTESASTSISTRRNQSRGQGGAAVRGPDDAGHHIPLQSDDVMMGQRRFLKANKSPKTKKSKKGSCKKGDTNSFTLQWSVQLQGYTGAFQYTLQQSGNPTPISAGTSTTQTICLDNGMYSLVWDTCGDTTDTGDNVL